jgi:stage V sporulation protein G
MKITDIRIRRLEGNSKMKAIVSITIDDEFVLHDIKVVDGEKGLFIAMPSKKTSDGEYRDIAHPIKTETRNRIQTLILDRYTQEDEVVEEPILTGAI